MDPTPESISTFKLLKQAKKYVQFLFKLKKNKALLYHNLGHTLEVVKASKRIARNYELSKEDYTVLLLSSWFHDVGYLTGTANHEQQSAEYADFFLSSANVDSKTIELVRQAILATRIPQQPVSLIEKILCDADLYYLGGNDFIRKSNLLRKERKLLNGDVISKSIWREQTVNFLNSKRYFTDYAISRREHGKQKNMRKLIKLNS